MKIPMQCKVKKNLKLHTNTNCECGLNLGYPKELNKCFNCPNRKQNKVA